MPPFPVTAKATMAPNPCRDGDSTPARAEQPFEGEIFPNFQPKPLPWHSLRPFPLFLALVPSSIPDPSKLRFCHPGLTEGTGAVGRLFQLSDIPFFEVNPCFSQFLMDPWLQGTSQSHPSLIPVRATLRSPSFPSHWSRVGQQDQDQPLFPTLKQTASGCALLEPSPPENECIGI